MVICLLMLACNGNQRPKKPENLISKDKMALLIYDLYIINAAKGVNRKLLESNGLVPETYILTKYNIDSTQFADSNTYYAFEPEDYKGIIEKVKTRLEKDKDTFEALQRAESMEAKRKRDSIRAIADKKKEKFKSTSIDTAAN